MYAVYYIRGVEEQDLTAEEREALTTAEVSILCSVFQYACCIRIQYRVVIGKGYR